MPSLNDNGPVPGRFWLRMGLWAALSATAAAAQERADPPGPCPEDSARETPQEAIRDTLLSADLASATHDLERAGDLLAEAAERAPGSLSPPDWLMLARRDESRGELASATARWGRYLKSLEGREEDTRWVGQRLRQLNIAAQAGPPAGPGAHVPPIEARIALADGRAAVARVDGKAARESFGIALRLDAGYADAAVAAGALDARAGRAADAIREYRMALAAEPNRVDAMVPLSNLLWEHPDRASKAESLLLLDRAAAARAELPSLRRRSAERWAEWGDSRAALERLDAWRAIAPASERRQTDRLREELAARAPSQQASGPAAAPVLERRALEGKAAPSIDPPATSPASTTPRRPGIWIWGAGAALVIALGAGLRALSRRRSVPPPEPIAPVETFTRVDAGQLLRILERVAAESHVQTPPFVTKGFPEVEKPPWYVRIPPPEWETIWRAVFANTLSAMRAARVASPRLALFGSVVRDSKVAGVAVRLALADNAPGTLTTESIHAGSPGNEWAVVDRLIRVHGGSIAVSPSIDRHFTKRLLIELPSAE